MVTEGRHRGPERVCPDCGLEAACCEPHRLPTHCRAQGGLIARHEHPVKPDVVWGNVYPFPRTPRSW